MLDSKLLHQGRVWSSEKVLSHWDGAVLQVNARWEISTAKLMCLARWVWQAEHTALPWGKPGRDKWLSCRLWVEIGLHKWLYVSLPCSCWEFISFCLRFYIKILCVVNINFRSQPSASSFATKALIRPRCLLIKEKVLLLGPTNLFCPHCRRAAWEQERSCGVWEDTMLVFESHFSLFSETVNGKTTLNN